MKSTFFIVFDKNGAQKVTKTPPSQNSGEVAMELTATIPDALFKRPLLRGTIVVSENGGATIELQPATLDAMSAALKVGTGMEVKVTKAPAKPARRQTFAEKAVAAQKTTRGGRSR